MKQVLVLRVAASFWNGSRYFFRHMAALKTNWSPFWHAVKMVFSRSLWLAKLLSSRSSALHFPKKMQIEINSQCAMNLQHVVRGRKPPLLAPHSLLLDLIRSPLRVSDIGLIHFCLDSVLFCHDPSPDLAMWALACGATDPFEPHWPTSHTETLFKSTRASSSHWWGWFFADFCYTTNAVMLWPTVSWAHTQCLEEREWSRPKEQQTERPSH